MDAFFKSYHSTLYCDLYLRTYVSSTAIHYNVAIIWYVYYMCILIADVNYEFVIERRTSENVHFSRGLFALTGTSVRNDRISVSENNEMCIQDDILFRVSLPYIY